MEEPIQRTCRFCSESVDEANGTRFALSWRIFNTTMYGCVIWLSRYFVRASSFVCEDCSTFTKQRPRAVEDNDEASTTHVVDCSACGAAEPLDGERDPRGVPYRTGPIPMPDADRLNDTRHEDYNPAKSEYWFCQQCANAKFRYHLRTRTTSGILVSLMLFVGLHLLTGVFATPEWVSVGGPPALAVLFFVLYAVVPWLRRQD